MDSATLRTVLRRLVLGAATIVTLVIALLFGQALRSAAGWSFDPHGYGVIAGVLFGTVLTPVALALWLLYRSMRHHNQRR
ncbi:putative membrane protein [Catenuloplanes nepalensis]|uniref:Membrane protein n=1 Tax=Catenuloplanes nepalensis TaxID=587533 RepID=A0ABT9MQR1_9ACTN|nr:hypothetical protein [Catenuloplanes nepalensis]MDP9793738.1 putative membrane protein [Catenuloplanes nepalensis]